jgi:hypothetical protein
MEGKASMIYKRETGAEMSFSWFMIIAITIVIVIM